MTFYVTLRCGMMQCHLTLSRSRNETEWISVIGVMCMQSLGSGEIFADAPVLTLKCCFEACKELKTMLNAGLELSIMIKSIRWVSFWLI